MELPIFKIYMNFSRHHFCCFTIVPLFVLDQSMAWNGCLQHPCFKNLCKNCWSLQKFIFQRPTLPFGFANTFMISLHALCTPKLPISLILSWIDVSTLFLSLRILAHFYYRCLAPYYLSHLYYNLPCKIMWTVVIFLLLLGPPFHKVEYDSRCKYGATQIVEIDLSLMRHFKCGGKDIGVKLRGFYDLSCINKCSMPTYTVDTQWLYHHLCGHTNQMYSVV
jgi:hypothetical protein